MAVPNSSAATAAAWNVADFNLTNQQAVRFQLHMARLQAAMDAGGAVPALHDSVAAMKEFLWNLFKKKREAATHSMVIMAANEYRRAKPYCISLQYIPYTSIRDQQIRDLTVAAKRDLLDHGLVGGGEYV